LRVALVTGASRGIGGGIAETLADRGFAVALNSREESRDRAEEVAEHIADRGHRAVVAYGDVSDPSDVGSLVSSTIEALGPPDVLVNNAGVISRDALEDHEIGAFRRILSVNLEGTFNCTKAVLPHMLEAGYGRIINMTSIAGRIGDLTAAPSYGASKGGISALTKSVARAVAARGITVNAVAPHAIETEMSAQWSQERRAQIVAAIPVKRLGTIHEVAEAVAFLASEGSGFITGQVLHVNGGFLMDG
jgi:3-oxoacyl-[acyl-carrier protein] reductase